MVQLTPQQLKQWLDDESKPRPVLLDVREPWEYATCHIPQSMPLPMQTIPARIAELDAAEPHVVICHHGVRSQQVGIFLERYGFTRIFNLQGGVNAWSQTVEPSMPRY